MLREMLERYQPKCEQEVLDKALMLAFFDANPDCLSRTNLAGHFTSSAIVVNEAMTHVLFAFHNIYQSWSWLGGHNDGSDDALDVALREAKEETGVDSIRPYDGELFTIDVIYVPNHIKKSRYVPDHLHLNTTFLLIADDAKPLTIKPDENSGVRWFSWEEVFSHVSEPRMMPVYQKAYRAIREQNARRKG
jgi:8-oxo-dGTP pyrophosphatase MutT (NUDIX family)